jgi:hypothetical protein
MPLEYKMQLLPRAKPAGFLLAFVPALRTDARAISSDAVCRELISRWSAD